MVNEEGAAECSRLFGEEVGTGAEAHFPQEAAGAQDS